MQLEVTKVLEEKAALSGQIADLEIIVATLKRNMKVRCNSVSS